MTEVALGTEGSVADAFELALAAARSAHGERALWCGVGIALCEGIVAADRVASWFQMPAPPGPRLLDPLRRARDAGALAASRVGNAYERRATTVTRGGRRDNGVYFTPPDLAHLVVESTLAPLLESAVVADDVLAVTVCDPAAGAGAFMLPALDQLAARVAEISPVSMALAEARRSVLERSLYGVDVDAVTTALLRSVLCAHVADAGVDLDAVEAHVVCGDSVAGPPPGRRPAGRRALDWGRAFPHVFEGGGFHAIVGNPPWGPVKAVNRHRDGGVDEWLVHRDRKRAYVSSLREAGYEFQGVGDTDFYRYFLERSHQLVRPRGRIGLVVPSALQRAEGAAPLRRLLFGDGTCELMLDFVNTGRIFDIHGMFRFMVLVWQQGVPGGVGRTAFALRSVTDARNAARAPARVTMDHDFLRSASGERMSVPDIRDAAQADLFARLHRGVPPLGTVDQTTWNVAFSRELDMTNDADAFLSVAQATAQSAIRCDDGTWHHAGRGVLLPLYEGRMVHQYDIAAKQYVNGTGRSARWEPLLPGEKAVRPQYLVPAEAVAHRVDRIRRAAFCDVTGHANERTVLAALVPAASACGNKVPTVRFDRDDPRLPLLWVAIANSFVVDWLVRRRVATTLNFFVWAQVPFPRLDPDSDIGSELVALASSLTEPASSPWDADAWIRRATWRAAVDAAVADAYGLDLRDLALVLSDFPLLDRNAAGTGTRTTVTRDLALQTLALRRGEPDVRLGELGLTPDDGPRVLTERVAEAAARGEIAYVPGEMAASQRRREAGFRPGR